MLSRPFSVRRRAILSLALASVSALALAAPAAPAAPGYRLNSLT
jgi:hypothetical protein